MRCSPLLLFPVLGVLLAISIGCGVGSNASAAKGSPDFSISTTPSSQTVAAGSAATYTIQVSGTNGFHGTVSLQLSGLPSGATGSFSPINASGVSTLTVTTTNSTPGGSSTVTVMGTSGNLSHSTSFTLVVSSSAPPPASDFTLSAAPTSRSVAAGAITTYTIQITGTNGFNGTVSLGVSGLPSGATGTFSPINGGSSTLSVTTASSTPAGSSTLKVTGVSGTLSHSTKVTLIVSTPPSSPDFSLAATPSTQTLTAGASATYTLTATALSGFNGTIFLSAGTLPAGVTTTFNPSSLNGAGSSTVTVATTSSTPAGSYSITLTGTSVSLTHSASVNLTVNAAAPAGFSLSASPVQETVAAGASTHYSITVTPSNGFNQSVTLSVSGLPTGATASFNTDPVPGGTGSSTLLVQTASTTPAGNSTLTVTGSGGGQTQMLSLPLTVTAATTGTMPQFGHVFIVMGENTNYSTSYSSSNMPYLTSLANQYGVATKYWADTHPSIGNDLAMASGVISSNNDSDSPSSLPLSIDNLAFEVQQAGKTWKDYVESGNGCGAVNSGKYYVRHDPLEYYTNINTERANFVCFSQFATDLANHTLPNFSWLAPNGTDDGHDSSPSTFDSWLKTVLTPLLASSYFQTGGDGLLIITFDEDDKGGTPNCTTTTLGKGCGGQVETVVISARSKMGYKSTAGDPANYNNTYDEGNIVRTIADALGLKTSGLGGASTRVPMADFFQ